MSYEGVATLAKQLAPASPGAPAGAARTAKLSAQTLAKVQSATLTLSCAFCSCSSVYAATTDLWLQCLYCCGNTRLRTWLTSQATEANTALLPLPRLCYYLLPTTTTTTIT